MTLLGDTPTQPIPLSPVPEGLSDAEAALWRAVVESKPSDYFGRESWPVLKEFCRAAIMCDVLAALITDAIESGEVRQIRRALETRDREAKRMADIATKLRMTQQSRYTAQTAATADRLAKGKRPWQSDPPA